MSKLTAFPKPTADAGARAQRRAALDRRLDRLLDAVAKVQAAKLSLADDGEAAQRGKVATRASGPAIRDLVPGKNKIATAAHVGLSGKRDAKPKPIVWISAKEAARLYGKDTPDRTIRRWAEKCGWAIRPKGTKKYLIDRDRFIEWMQAPADVYAMSDVSAVSVDDDA